MNLGGIPTEIDSTVKYQRAVFLLQLLEYLQFSD
jgi:hypothetical protein